MKREAVARVLLAGALAVVGVVVVWGFTLIGSPSFNRKLSADKNRAEDLQRLADDVEQYFSEHKKFPEKLADLKEPEYSYGRGRQLEDPTTKKPYEFKVKDAFSYELCAEFELTSQEADLERRPYSYSRNRTRWDHGVGRSCFSLEIPATKR